MKNVTNDRRNFLSKMLITGISGATLFSSMLHARRPRTRLNKQQRDELFFMYQEEKVARDVYITLGKLYPSANSFASIQLSEQRHIDAVENLCLKYNVDISKVNEEEIGTFVLPELQELYDTCVAQGEESLLDALKVGETIEITDISDLDNAINNLDMPNDVINVFENLREGSYNHLESFQVAIARELS